MTQRHEAGKKTPKKPKPSAAKAMKPEDIELHPDAWERFERGVKTLGQKKAAKSTSD
jgi:hypothetical protein